MSGPSNDIWLNVMAGAVKEPVGVVPPKAIEVGVTTAVIVKVLTATLKLHTLSLRFGSRYYPLGWHFLADSTSAIAHEGDYGTVGANRDSTDTCCSTGEGDWISTSTTGALTV
jgi:hypothetical protein